MTRAFALRLCGCTLALALVSCFRDSTGPGSAERARFVFAPVFESQATAACVDFDHVRVRLIPAAGGAAALDTVIPFPSSADSLVVGLTVPVSGTSETFDLTLALINAAGDTVFQGGPVSVTVQTGTLPAVAPQVLMRYTGVGANAVGVRFVLVFPPTVFFGDTLTLVATGIDSSGAPIAAAPVELAIDARDTALASVPNKCTGKVVGRSSRGTARVIGRLLTGPADTTAVLVEPKPAVLAVVSGAGQTGPAGFALAQPLRFRVKSADSLPEIGASVAFAVTAGGGSLTVPAAITDTGGYASVGWTLGSLVGTQTMTATVAALAPVSVNATATAGTAAITLTVPGNLVGIGAKGLALVKLSPPAPAGGVTVTLTSDSTQYLTVGAPDTMVFAAGDTLKARLLNGVAAGTAVLHATAPGYAAGTATVGVTPNYIFLQAPFTISAGQSAPLAIRLFPTAPASPLVVTLASTDSSRVKVTTPTVSFAAGQDSADATVQGVALGAAGITAAATGYADGGTVVTVAGAAKTLLLISGGNQTATPGTTLPQSIIVEVVDSVGNGITGFPVTFAVATGGGSLSTTSTTTVTGGLATTNWTLGTATGPQTITVTATGLAGSPLTVTANPSSAVASTTVTPKLDTITAINGTFTLVAQAKDASGNNVTGSFTWTSRDTTIAKVNVAGVVSALANGSTYVLATEAGGTKDSAQIVVQQKLATISVTPANRSLYLGTSYKYKATAEDGLGTPLPTQPTFNWSTSAAAVASVDTSQHGDSNTVNALGLGTVQIKAASGTVTGVGNLSVITAITRIAVAVDSSGSTKPDTATLTALTATRRYHAYAYDTLNALMPAVTQFTWASSNPSVAAVPNVTADTVTATAAANGVTAIRATAQGFTSAPGAALTVAQKLTSIQLSPATATIGVGGQAALTARGVDSLGHFISGGTFGFVSKDTLIAKVGATTGVVTGVALGADTVVADSAAITSNPALITVSSSVPAAISFGRDTVSVGRGSQASIPILLSTPVPASGPALTVLLGVSPAAYAHWSTTSVSIPAGGVSVNATLVGDSAGTTTVTATDSVGKYAAASAVAKVTANMSLASSSYYVNATDVATTQVLLSDPSPAGGTYVTFSYGTAGIASVSPNPAYIPAGQLAADIQISAVAAGTSTITPVAAGVNGVASTFTAYAPVLTMYPAYPLLLGLGQYYPNEDVQLPTKSTAGLTVTLTSSDTTKVTVPATASVPSGSYYSGNFAVSAIGLGRAAVTPSATGWTAGNVDSVIVTTPHVGISGGGTIYSTAGAQYMYVYSEDSTGASHNRTNSLVVNLRSSNPSVMAVVDTTVTINPGSYYTSGPFVTPGIGGTAWIVASASGHTPDSVQYTVVGPPLSMSWTSLLLGAGQQDINGVYVSVPNNVPSPLVVKLASSDSTRASVPDSVIIPTGSNYVYFTIRGLALGVDTVRATAVGFQSDSATITVGRPAITLNTTSLTFNQYNAGSNFYIYSADTTRTTHQVIAPDTVSITVRNPAVATVDSSTAIIPAGQYYNGSRHITPVGVGSTYLVVSAPGQIALDSMLISVNTPAIQISFGSTTLGRRQHISSSGNGFYIYTPDSRSVPVPATMAQKHPTVDSLSRLNDTIPAGQNSVYLDAFGLANGTDTITVSATGYNSGSSAYVTVTTPKLKHYPDLQNTTTTNTSAISVWVYATDSINNSASYPHYTMDTVTVHAVSSDTTVIKPDSAYYHIAKNATYVQTSVHVFGPGSAHVVFSDSANSGYLPDTTNTVTVTGPSLTFSPTSTVLGMRQTTGAAIELYTQNNVTQNDTVYLTSTGTRVVTVPDSVIIPAGQSYVYFAANALDTLGTIQIQARATGFAPAAMTIRVTHPKFAISTSSQLNTTSPRSTVTVYAEDSITGNTHYTTDTVIVHLASSAISVANVDSSVVTILPGQYYNNHATWGPGSVSEPPGTAVLTATDTTPALYAYQLATYSVAVVTPKLGLTWSTQTVGMGQYTSQYPYSPDNAVNPIVVGLNHAGTARASLTINGTAISVDTIPAGSNSARTFHVVGTAVGMDTLVASASSPPFIPDTAYTTVTSGHVDNLGNWPATLSLSGTDSVLVTLYARDSTLNTHYVQDSTTFTLTPSGSIVFVSGGANSAVITSAVIPKDAYYVQFYVKATGTGSGTATISATNYVTYPTPPITVNP